MLGGAGNPHGELPSYITGADIREVTQFTGTNYRSKEFPQKNPDYWLIRFRRLSRWLQGLTVSRFTIIS